MPALASCTWGCSWVAQGLALAPVGSVGLWVSILNFPKTSSFFVFFDLGDKVRFH